MINLSLAYRERDSGNVPPLSTDSEGRVNRLYVSELPLSVKEMAMQQTFGQFGSVSSVRLIRKADYCFAFVNFEHAADAERAIMKLDKTSAFGEGRAIRVQYQRGGGANGGPEYRHRYVPSPRLSQYNSVSSKRPGPEEPDMEDLFPKALNGVTMDAMAVSSGPAPGSAIATDPTDRKALEERIAAYDREREAERMRVQRSRDEERERERLARQAAAVGPAFVGETTRIVVSQLPSGTGWLCTFWRNILLSCSPVVGRPAQDRVQACWRGCQG